MERIDFPSQTVHEPRPQPAVRRPNGATRSQASHPDVPLAEQLSRIFPAGVLVGIAWALAWKTDGSIAARDWLPYALLSTLVLAGVFLAGGRARPNRTQGIALGLLAAYAAFCALSLTWAPLPSLARDEALLVLFYVVALAVGLASLRTPEDRLFAGGAVAAGAVTLTLATALKLRSAAHPDDLFLGGRLDFPITYVNAQAAMLLTGFWPAIVVAARRSAPAWLRALAVGGAASLLAGWLLTQSKGGAVGLVVSAVAVFGVSSVRLRLAVPTLIAAVLAFAGFRPLTAPIRASSTAQLQQSIHHAATILLVLFVVASAAGAAYAIADRRIRVRSGARELAGRLARWGVVLLAVLAFGALLAHHPLRLLHEFKQPPTQGQAGGTHLLSLGGSHRYDTWRVALGEFARHPLVGVGARGFAPAYLMHRKSDESPARAHSFEADALSETGLIGFALLAGALFVLLRATGRRARLEPAAAGALGGAVYVLAHASVDWVWTFPAVGVPLFLLLGAGASGGVRRTQKLTFRTGAIVAAGLVALALVAFTPPWLSGQYNERALDAGPGAMSDVRSARRFDPLAVEPLITESQLEPTPAAAIRPLQQAVRTEPRAYAMHYLLAFADYRAGHVAAARRELLEARRLNPRDPFVEQALSRLPKPH